MTHSVADWIVHNPYAADLGVKVEAVGETTARFSLRHEARHAMAGTLHGGAIASLVSVTTRAIASASAPAKSLCSTSMQVSYARAARESLTVETRLVRQAREIAFFETRMAHANGDVVAFASSVVGEGQEPAAGASPEAVSEALRPQGMSASTAPEVIRRAMAAIPFLSGRELTVGEVGGGMVEVLLGPADVNLDANGCMDEGALLAILDAAGATCPWTVVSPSPGATGATVALTAQVLGPLPKEGLVARATLRAHAGRSYWSDVTISDERSRRIRAFGTVQYRLRQRAP